MQRSAVVDVDISQKAILNKLVAYLNSTASERDPEIVKKLTQELLGPGYCAGLSAVAAYGQWLQTQPSTIDTTTGKPKPRDDWEWFKATRDTIARWDGSSSLAKEDKNNIERFLSLIEYFQKISGYLPITENELQKSMEDTQGRKPANEYHLTGLFTLENLKIILPQIFPKERTIFIESYGHVISLFRYDDKTQGDMIIFYDSNNPEGEQYYNYNNQKVESEVVNAMEYKAQTPSPFSIRVFSFDEKATPASYPLHRELLSDLPLDNHVANYAKNYTALHTAARFGSMESLKFYAENASPDDWKKMADKDGNTPVHLSAQHGQLEVLNFLLEQKVDLNQPNRSGYMPIHLAAYEGHKDVVAFLVKNNINLNQLSRNGYLPVHFAAQNGKVEMLSFLKSQNIDLNQVSRDGYMPVHFAANRGHPDTLSFLADNDVDLNQPSRNGNLPIHLAAQNGQVESLRFLAKQKIDLSQPNREGDTPAHIAARNGHVEVLRFLAIQNIEFLNQVNQEGDTAAHIAAFSGQVEVLRFLASCGVDVYQKNQNEDSPLDIAIQNNQMEVIRFFAEKSLELKQSDNASMYMVEQNEIEILRFFVNLGIDLSQPNHEGDTPAHIAARNGYVAVLRYLADLNIELLNQSNQDGDTPAHIAAFSDHVDVLRFLAGCENVSLDRENANGDTPAALAEQNDSENVVRFFSKEYLESKQSEIDTAHTNSTTLIADILNIPITSPTNDHEIKIHIREEPAQHQVQASQNPKNTDAVQSETDPGKKLSSGR